LIYLACVLDAWSRRCVGWQLSGTIDTQLTLAALNHVSGLRQATAGLTHQSDRGVRYASASYVERLQGIGAHVSMSATGNPYENAKAESLFKTLKREEVYLNQYETFADAEGQSRYLLLSIARTSSSLTISFHTTREDFFTRRCHLISPPSILRYYACLHI
jgi:transposase InsO family protein